MLRIGRIPGLAGSSECGYLSGWLRAWAQATLLAATDQQGMKLYTLADIERTDSFGRPDFVAADGKQVHSQLVWSERYL